MFAKMIVWVFVVVSACGGIRTDKKMPVLTAYFPEPALGILGKGGLFVAPPLGYGLFYPSWNKWNRLTAWPCGSVISVADYQALT